MKIPKKYQNKIECIEEESGLIDDCRYMVYLKDGLEHYVYGSSFAINNGKELKDIMMGVE